jgi:hypothetical protein
MKFLQKNWWKLLPIFLFFFGWTGVILFIILLAIYGISHFIPFDPKRGKLLTWLIIIDVISLVQFFIHAFNGGIQLNAIGVFSILIDSLEALCLIGIWKWKKIAAVAFIIFFSFDLILEGVKVSDSSYPWFVDFFGFMLVLIVWLGLWIFAFKWKWTRFT